MAERTVLLSITADPSGLIAGTEQSKKAIQGLGTTVSQESTKASYGFGKLGSQLSRLPRTSIFPMLNMELISLTSSMTGTTMAGASLQRGMMVLQGAGGALLGPMGLLVGALVGLAAAFTLSKLKTEEHSKALKELKKQIEEAEKEAKAIEKDKEQYEKLKIELEKLETQRWRLINQSLTLNRTTTILYAQLSEQIKKVREEISVYEKLFPTLNEGIALSQIEYKLAIGQTIPALKQKITTLATLIERLKEQNRDWQTNKKVLNEITLRTKELTEAEQQLLEIKEDQKTKEQELNSVFLNQIILKRELEKLAKKGLSLKVEGKPSPAEEITKMKDALVNFKDAMRSGIFDISDAFVDMMMGVEVKWGDLLKSLIAQLIKSGLQDLIIKLLSGGGILGSIGGFLGFQGGTPYVPKTGAYMLHRGEAVVPAHRNVSYVRNYNSGGNTTNYNVLYLDPEKLTRRSIVPMIEKMVQNRQTRLVMG